VGGNEIATGPDSRGSHGNPDAGAC
jgi:hypothetical protein